MASMELTDARSTEEGAELTEYRPRYAVGELYLGDDAMAALGLSEMPKPGTKIRFSGTAVVTSINMRQDNRADTDGPDCNMSIQPVELTFGKPAADAKAMFPKSKMEN